MNIIKVGSGAVLVAVLVWMGLRVWQCERAIEALQAEMPRAQATAAYHMEEASHDTH